MAGAGVTAPPAGPPGGPGRPGPAWPGAGQSRAEAKGAGQHISAAGFLQVFGPLWYEQQLLYPSGGTTRQDRTMPEPEPAAADASPSSADADTPGLMLLCTTLATWWLLTCPDAVYLNQWPVPTAEQAADRAAGLPPARSPLPPRRASRDARPIPAHLRQRTRRRCDRLCGVRFRRHDLGRHDRPPDRAEAGRPGSHHPCCAPCTTTACA